MGISSLTSTRVSPSGGQGASTATTSPPSGSGPEAQALQTGIEIAWSSYQDIHDAPAYSMKCTFEPAGLKLFLCDTPGTCRVFPTDISIDQVAVAGFPKSLSISFAGGFMWSKQGMKVQPGDTFP